MSPLKKLVDAVQSRNVKREFKAAIERWFKDKGDETLRLDYALTPDSVVFDLGGYKGDFAFEIHQRYSCRVFVFEPVKRYHLACLERFKGNDKIVCLNYGLADADGSFRISDEDDGSSITKTDARSQSEEVFVKRFDEQMKLLQVAHIDLLKINVEGAEFLILPHVIAQGLMPKIEHLQVQFHSFYPGAKVLRDEIRRRLAETHEEKWNYTFVWESWSRRR